MVLPMCRMSVNNPCPRDPPDLFGSGSEPPAAAAAHGEPEAGGGMHERHTSRSAGYRHPDPPARGLSGTGLVADDLYLLGHDDRSGKPLLQPRALGTGLAGALLAELMLAGCIGLRHDGTVVITSDTAPGRGAAAPAAQAGSGRARTSAGAVLAAVPGPQRGTGCGRCAWRRPGTCEHVRSRVPWSQGQWIPVNPDWAFAPMLRVRSALDPARPLTAHAAALAGLAVACGLGFRVDQYRAPGPQRPGRRRRSSTPACRS